MAEASAIQPAVAALKDPWLSLMRTHGCEGEFYELSKRIIDSLEAGVDFHEAFSDSEQLSILVDMVFDAGFYAGRSATA